MGISSRYTGFCIADLIGADRCIIYLLFTWLVNYQHVSVSVEPAKYLKQFNWDGAKYPTKQPLRNLAEIISKVHSYSFKLI